MATKLSPAVKRKRALRGQRRAASTRKAKVEAEAKAKAMACPTCNKDIE